MVSGRIFRIKLHFFFVFRSFFCTKQPSKLLLHWREENIELRKKKLYNWTTLSKILRVARLSSWSLNYTFHIQQKQKQSFPCCFIWMYDHISCSLKFGISIQMKFHNIEILQFYLSQETNIIIIIITIIFPSAKAAFQDSIQM